MSGFFSSLAAKQLQLQEQEQEDHHNQRIITDNNNNNSSLQFLFKNNEEIYNKGFELWQQYYQLHHQKSNHRNLTLQDFDFSVGPSSRRSSSGGGGGGGGDDCLDYGYRSAAGFRVTTTTAAARQGRGGGGGEGMNCQDCGNQAKKDCPHMRCRTCCKSRGYHCQTHVKSTWVPAAKRRERQQLNQLQVENPKRLREDPSAAAAAGGGAGGSALACTTTSGFELGRHFPPEVSSPAEFRCVRVSGVDDAEEHLAYQTAVNIGGHLFKGILYDQGPESRYPSAGAGESSSGYGGSQQQLPLDLISAATATTSHQNTTDPSINYPTPLCAFMAGTQFFPPPRQ